MKMMSKELVEQIKRNPEKYAEDIYTVERNREDFKKLYDYLMENEPIDKKLKDDAGMFFYPSIIIEAFTKEKK